MRDAAIGDAEVVALDRGAQHVRREDERLDGAARRVGDRVHRVAMMRRNRELDASIVGRERVHVVEERQSRGQRVETRRAGRRGRRGETAVADLRVEEVGERLRLDAAEAQQVVADAPPQRALRAQRLLDVGGLDELRGDEPLADAAIRFGRGLGRRLRCHLAHAALTQVARPFSCLSRCSAACASDLAE